MSDKYFPDEIGFNCGHSVHRTEINCPRCKEEEIDKLKEVVADRDKEISHLKMRLNELVG